MQLIEVKRPSQRVYRRVCMVLAEYRTVMEMVERCFVAGEVESTFRFPKNMSF